MGGVGNAYDNAMWEPFSATLECELIDRYRLRTQQEAETAVFEFIEGWCDPHRRHSPWDMPSPIEYESTHLGAAQFTSPDLSTETG
jgi:putative transposase